MKNKKIIHLITTIERGGAEKQLLILARRQSELGLQVEVLYLKGEPELKEDFESARCKVSDFLANKNIIVQLFRLSRYLKKFPTPIHAHLSKSELISSLVCPSKSFVVTRHNSESFWPGAPKIISKQISRFVCNRAAQVISISNAVKKFVLETGEINSKCKINVVHYGYDECSELSSLGLSELSSRISNSSRTFKIGSIGRLVYQKDFPTLLNAFKRVLINHPDSELYIVGSGKDRHYLEFLVSKLEIYENVNFLGRTQYISEFLSLMNLFVLPSRYEGFGLVLLEAMRAGIPILASNNSSIPEVLGSEYSGLFETGSFQELSQKIERTINDKSFESSLIREYSVELEKFEPTKMAENIIEIYNSVSF
jgi:glycosyltransferase involved in cell wall biosynthesis